MIKFVQFIFVLAFSVISFWACVHEPVFLDPIDTSELITNDGKGTNGSSSSSCDPDTVYFQNQILPIFIGSCAATGCHDVNSHEEGVVTVDYATIKRGIVAGNPSRSKYYRVLTASGEDLMPRQPGTENGFRLPDEQIALIRKWIEQDALNNSCDACDTTDYTFGTRISPIIGTSCATSIGCHASGSTYGQFTSYANIKPYIDNGAIYERAIVQQSMPPAGPLPNCDMEALKKWIEDGAPNN